MLRRPFSANSNCQVMRWIKAGFPAVAVTFDVSKVKGKFFERIIAQHSIAK
jgi:hypothetical protein